MPVPGQSNRNGQGHGYRTTGISYRAAVVHNLWLHQWRPNGCSRIGYFCWCFSADCSCDPHIPSLGRCNVGFVCNRLLVPACANPARINKRSILAHLGIWLSNCSRGYTSCDVNHPGYLTKIVSGVAVNLGRTNAVGHGHRHAPRPAIHAQQSLARLNPA